MGSTESTEVVSGSAAATVALESWPQAAELPTEEFDRLLVGRYRLRRQLGSGGFGVVWEAYDEQLQRLVAIKQIGGSRRRLARAEREAVAAARLNHPNVTQLYEFASEGGTIYLISELVHGNDLAELLEDEELSDRDIAKIGLAICEALQHAHERGVVHRDVKPHNIMVLDRYDSDAGIAKLMDFGIAQIAQSEPLTGTGDVVGTLAYMAPEQAAGKRAGAPADVYGMALTLYEAWAGDNPARAEGAAATIRRASRGVPSLRKSRPDLPAELIEAIDHSLDVRPDRRPQCTELSEALGACVDELDDRNSLIRARGGDALFSGLLPLLPSWVGRVANAVAIAVLIVIGIAAVGAPPSLPVPLLGLAGGVVALILPRLAWLAATAALIVWSASPAVGKPGLALVIACAAVLPLLVLPVAKRLWSFPALAPLLALVGLGSGFVVCAGMIKGPLRRAALGAIGVVWLELVQVATQRQLLGGPPAGSAGAASWQGSLGDALHLALTPLISTTTAGLILIWAIFAVALPSIVRGRSFVFDVVAICVWAAGLLVAQQELLTSVGGLSARQSTGGLIAAVVAVLCGLVIFHVQRADAGH